MQRQRITAERCSRSRQLKLDTQGLNRMDEDLAPKLAQLQAALAEPESEGDLSTRPLQRECVCRQAHDPRTQCESRPLTKREIDVLKCIAEGESTKQMAHTLGITFKTACCHRQRVMEKLSIHDTARLVRYAIRTGLVQA